MVRTQLVGVVAPAAECTTPNERDNTTHFQHDETAFLSPGFRHVENCAHAHLRLVIDLASNAHYVYCTDCLTPGPTATNPAHARAFFDSLCAIACSTCGWTR
jgi:hypothetical protein